MTGRGIGYLIKLNQDFCRGDLNTAKAPKRGFCTEKNFFLGSQGSNLDSSGSKPDVLPLHHSPIKFFYSFYPAYYLAIEYCASVYFETHQTKVTFSDIFSLCLDSTLFEIQTLK